MTKTVKIVILPGDGVGPEVIGEAKKVLDKSSELFDLALELSEFPCGGRYYLENGVEWPSEALPAAKEADAILFGAIGHPGARLPDGNIAGASIVLGLRFSLDLFANIRPTKLFPGVKHKISGSFQQIWQPSNVDFTIIRENTEGLYAPIRGSLVRGGYKEVAIDTRIITTKGAERVIRFAFDYSLKMTRGAPKDNKKRVTAIHKNNLLSGCQLFTDVFYDISKEYSQVEHDDILVDSFTQSILVEPEHYNVCVTTNMMGDICTDLASVLQGGMGMAPSAQINGFGTSSKGFFEPVHGSAPDIAGKNIANPIGAILSVKMMFEWLAVKQNSSKFQLAADMIEQAVEQVIKSKKATVDIGGSSSTQQTGTAIVEKMTNIYNQNS